MTTQQPWQQPYMGGLADKQQQVPQQKFYGDHVVGQQLPVAPYQPMYRGPARTAHGAGYWLFVGCWWEPTKFFFRALLWCTFPLQGLWRSYRHHKKNQERRQRRGYR